MGVGINAKLTLCTQAASEMPGVRQQLQRLADLAAKNDVRQRAQIAAFVKEINAAGHLVDQRVDTLAASVSFLLQQSGSRNDTQLIRDIGSLAQQLRALRERIDAPVQGPEQNARIRAALAGQLGDSLAHLNLADAEKAFGAIGRIETKIDGLGERIDCASATPELFILALKGKMTDRVAGMVQCKPEIMLDTKVQAALNQMFEPETFTKERSFLENLAAQGMMTPPVACPASRHALAHGSADAFLWLLNKEPPKTLENCPGFVDAVFPGGGLMDIFPGANDLKALRRAGMWVDGNDYLLFRTLYGQWLHDLIQGIASKEITTNRFQWWVEEKTDAFAPSAGEAFRAQKLRVEADFKAEMDRQKYEVLHPYDEDTKSRTRAIIADYCPASMSYCSGRPRIRDIVAKVMARPAEPIQKPEPLPLGPPRDISTAAYVSVVSETCIWTLESDRKANLTVFIDEEQRRGSVMKSELARVRDAIGARGKDVFCGDRNEHITFRVRAAALWPTGTLAKPGSAARQ